MKSLKTYIINIIFMLVLISAAFYVLLKDQNMGDIVSAVKSANPLYTILAILMMFVFLGLQSLSMYIILRSFGQKLSYMKNFQYSFVGFFFNAITPSAGGGQPMQVYYMRDDKIPIGTSSVSLLFWTMIYKLALLIIQFFVLIFAHSFVVRTLGGYLWLYEVGIGVNLVSMILYCIIIFYTNGLRLLGRFGTWVLHKFRIIKHKKAFEKRLENAISIYAEGAVYVRQHLKITFIVLFITLIQRLCFFSIAWFACKALGQADLGIIKIMILESLVSVCIDILPFPGGAGVNEGFFVTIFKKFIPKHAAFSAMLLNRGVCFYAFVVISAFVSLAVHSRKLHIQAKSDNNA